LSVLVKPIAQVRLVPVPGGVLIQDGMRPPGAVGGSGDTHNDEIYAFAGIEAAALKANLIPGSLERRRVGKGAFGPCPPRCRGRS